MRRWQASIHEAHVGSKCILNRWRGLLSSRQAANAFSILTVNRTLNTELWQRTYGRTNIHTSVETRLGVASWPPNPIRCLAPMVFRHFISFRTASGTRRNRKTEVSCGQRCPGAGNGDIANPALQQFIFPVNLHEYGRPAKKLIPMTENGIGFVPFRENGHH